MTFETCFKAVWAGALFRATAHTTSLYNLMKYSDQLANTSMYTICFCALPY